MAREQDRILLQGIPSEEMVAVARAWMNSARASWLAPLATFEVGPDWDLIDAVHVIFQARVDPIQFAVSTHHGWMSRCYLPDQPEWKENTEASVWVFNIEWGRDGHWYQVGNSVGGVRLAHWNEWAAGFARCLAQAERDLRDRELIPRRREALEEVLRITEYDPEGLAVPVVGLVPVPQPEDRMLANPAIVLKGEQCTNPKAFDTAILWAKELWQSFLARSAFFEITVEGKWVPEISAAVRIKAHCPGRMDLRIHWIEGDRYEKSRVEIAHKGDPPHERSAHLYIKQREEWEESARRLVAARGKDFLWPLQHELEGLETLIQKAQGNLSSEG